MIFVQSMFLILFITISSQIKADDFNLLEREQNNTTPPKDFKEMCVEIGDEMIKKQYYGEDANFYFQDLDKIPYEEIEEKYLDRIDRYKPFILFNATKAPYVKVVLNSMLKTTNSFNSENTGLGYRENLKSYLQKSLSIPGLSLDEIIFWGFPLSSFSRQNLKGSEILSRFLCYNALHMFNCHKAVNFALKNSNPINIGIGRYFTAPENFTQIFINPIYHRPLIKTALLLLSRMELAELGLKVQSNIFDDLYEQFKAEGHSSLFASELTFNVLGAYGVRAGAINDVSWIADRNLPVFTAFSLMSGIMSYLDKYPHANEKQLYSLPKEVKTSCTYGKPYHFWLSAYIARSTRTMGAFSKKNSILASHFLGNIYEIFADWNGRNHRKVFKRDLYHPSLNAARLDNIMRGLGARFAVKYRPDKKNIIYQGDNLLKYSALHSRPSNYFPEKELSEMSPTEFIKYYKEWSKVLSANSHLWKLK